MVVEDDGWPVHDDYQPAVGLIVSHTHETGRRAIELRRRLTGNIKVETPEEFAAYDPTPNELMSRVFRTHRIEADVFHGRRIRPVSCPPAR